MADTSFRGLKTASASSAGRSRVVTGDGRPVASPAGLASPGRGLQAQRPAMNVDVARESAAAAERLFAQRPAMNVDVAREGAAAAERLFEHPLDLDPRGLTLGQLAKRGAGEDTD